MEFLTHNLKHKLHILKPYELPGDGQQLRMKHVGTLTLNLLAPNTVGARINP